MAFAANMNQTWLARQTPEPFTSLCGSSRLGADVADRGRSTGMIHKPILVRPIGGETRGSGILTG